MNTGDDDKNTRSWDDCRKYGCMLAGGGERWINLPKKLKIGDKLFAYKTKFGYTGFGVVVAEAVPFNAFVPNGHSKPLPHLPLTGTYDDRDMNDPNHWDMCVGVKWIKALPSEDAVLQSRYLRGTLCRIKQTDLVAALLKILDPADIAGQHG